MKMAVLLGIRLILKDPQFSIGFFPKETESRNMSSIDDPLLKELLAALKEDTQRMAADLLSIITTNALIALFALFLAVASRLP
jgi:hypothetical protein